MLYFIKNYPIYMEDNFKFIILNLKLILNVIIFKFKN